MAIEYLEETKPSQNINSNFEYIDEPAQSQNTFTPQQQQNIEKAQAFEQSVPGKVISTLEWPARFITGSKPWSQEMEQLYTVRNKEGLPGEIRYKTMATLEAGANMATFLLPEMKLLKGAFTIAGLLGASKAAEELKMNNDVESALKKGATTAAEVGVADIFLRGAAKPVMAAGKKVLGKIAEPAMEIRLAKESLETLKQTAQKLNIQTSITLNKLSNRLKNAQNYVKDKVSQITEQHVNSVKNNVENQAVALESINKDLNKNAFDLINPLSNVVKETKQKFNAEYNHILGPKELGKTPVNIDDDLNNLSNIMGIKSTTGTSIKDKLVNIANVLKPNLTKEEQGGLKLLTDKTSTAIALKDAHWLKQALYNYSSSLMNKSSNQELGVTLRNIASSVSNKIDQQVGGEYSKLSARYKNFLDIQDYVDSAIGKELVLGKDITRQGTGRILNQVKNVIKQGGEITDEIYYSQQKAIDAFWKQSQMLRENGLVKLADNLDNKLIKISNNALIGKNYREGIKALNEIIKDVPLKNELTAQLDNVSRKIETRMRALTTSKLKSRQLAQESEELLKAKIPKNDDMQFLGFSVAAHSIANLAREMNITTVAPITNILVGLYGIKKWGSTGADILYRGINAVENKINNTALPDIMRKSSLFLLSKIAND